MHSQNVLKIKCKNVKNCFVYLKPQKGLESGSPVKVVGDKNVFYFSVIFTDGVDYDSIGISSVYGRSLGFKEGQSVVVSALEPLPVVNRITIYPFTKADYEVLELLAQNVQSNLLDQVRVVKAGQKLVMWLGKNLYVTVIVETVQPVDLGILDFLTEVVIKHPTENSLQTTSQDNASHNEEKSESLIDFGKFWKKTSNIDAFTRELDMFNNPHYYCLRLAPLSKLPVTIVDATNTHQFTAYVSQSCLTSLGYSQNEPFYSMSLLKQSFSEKVVYIKLKLLDNCESTSDIFVQDCIFHFLKTNIGARIVLQKVTTQPTVDIISIEGKSNGQNIMDEVKKYLADNCEEPYILNAKFPLKLQNELYCMLQFHCGSASSQFCIIDQAFLRICSYSSNNMLVGPVEKSDAFMKYEESDNFYIEMETIKQVSSDILTALIKGDVFRGDNIMLTGNSGTGKTVVLHHIASTLRNYPHFLHTEIVYCKSLKGKTVESLQKFFADILATLIVSQPSLLVLDDLHVICEANQGEETPNSIHFTRVSEMLYSLFKIVQNIHCIGILASTISVSKLNTRIYRSRGRYLFDNVCSIGDLSRRDRICLLKHYFSAPRVELSFDYDEISLKTDGFVVQDIENLYYKSLFEAHKETPNQDKEPVICNLHCTEALKKSCALSLQNVHFHSPGDKSFSEIGGLHVVKSVLRESFLWPLKYSNIFANSPLRLQSGILLYGPPGTGKTLLAGATAKECGLRLISVKGPELLSKYIGASEQAVREVFEKAQRARPCILFFDEFDSLAPRRGHDNTGVTDRVVNQLLTQLDGVEALTGVCVLAATSRPDLLDSALLRPGRLDKQLLCPMPDTDERLETLNVLSDKLTLSEDVDLEAIALKTEGYTGADLYSVLCTAQLSTMKHALQINAVKPELSKIDQTCLFDALHHTRPSLTKSERKKYEMIYEKFRGGNLDNFKAGSKVTLA